MKQTPATAQISPLKHSPIPWTLEENGTKCTDICADESLTGGYRILRMETGVPMREENAAFIVVACNNHTRLVWGLANALAFARIKFGNLDPDFNKFLVVGYFERFLKIVVEYPTVRYINEGMSKTNTSLEERHTVALLRLRNLVKRITQVTDHAESVKSLRDSIFVLEAEECLKDAANHAPAGSIFTR